MAKAVFTAKTESVYDDLVEFRYHFPRTYLRQVEQAIGDWIVYYEPRRPTTDLSKTGGRQAYFATARVNRIERDDSRADHFYAYVTDYLPFEQSVPFREDASFYESALMKDDQSTNKGAFGRSVRLLPEQEYQAILSAGFTVAIVGEDQFYQAPAELEHHTPGLGEDNQTVFERPIVERLVARPFRDVAFRYAVREAYHSTCAMTGLKIINGGGRPEVQAAHIRSVAENGPDSIRNGVALSGTPHWMFDRGLLSIDDDYAILAANDHLPPQAKAMLNSSGKIILPERPDFQPHPRFLQYHREHIFKG